MGLTNSGQKDSAESHARRVREMFAKISPRYDLLNHLLSANIDSRWRRRVVRKLKPLLTKDAQVLHLPYAGEELSLLVLPATYKSAVGFIEGDALRLPFSDASFDGLTIGFALRNLTSVEQGLGELLRVLKPGGVVAILEFSRPVVPLFRRLVGFYNRYLLPWIGGVLSGSRGAYQYLPDSISKFPDQQMLATMMRTAGFEEVCFENLSGGIAALHTGRRTSRRI